MALNYAGYNPYPFAQLNTGFTPQQIPQSSPTPSSSFVWVQGEAGAKAYPVQNSKMVVLFDSEEKRFFIKTTDGSGIPQPLRIFEYTEVTGNKKEAPSVDTSMFVTKDELNEAINSLKQSQNKPQTNVENVQRKDGNKHGKPSVQ
jgi:hypothetical protein